MIICCVGSIGAGKTLVATDLAEIFSKYDMVLLSNYNCKFDGFLYDDPNVIARLPPTDDYFILGDEFYLYMDSRSYSNAKNIELSKIILQTRKKNVILCITAQTLGLVDKRIRLVSDYVLHVQGSFIQDPYSYFYYETYKQNAMALTDELSFVKVGRTIRSSTVHNRYDTREILGLNDNWIDIKEELISLHSSEDVFS